LECGWGINTRVELAEHEIWIQDILRTDAMENGVTMIDPASVTLSYDTQLGQDVIIEPNVVFGTGVRVADNVKINAFSHIVGTEVEEGAEIGPYARIRPKSKIEAGASVGNFVEVNRSTLKAGAKSKHVSYIGDAVIGKKTNIGAGTVIANYDGFFKHQSTIGDEVFVGSNATIISPVEVGDGAILAANSTINKDVPGNAMAVARQRQENHNGWASEYRKMKLEQKAQEEED
jgi:bifunctional UDP-N-acetylglucosamine pyrophosphorylase/glucosamine-1-phosphate N-acetyltransferase